MHNTILSVFIFVVLASSCTVRMVAAQDAINAAVGVLRNAVNAAIPGVSIL